MEQQLRGNGSRAKKTLFVCRNNIARSQWGAAYLNKIYPGTAVSAGTDVEARGTFVGDWEDPERDKFIWLAVADGIDIARNARTPLDEKSLRGIGHIIITDLPAVEALEERRGGRLPWPVEPDYWELPDPHHRSEEECRDIQRIIKYKVGALATSSTMLGGKHLGREAYMYNNL